MRPDVLLGASNRFHRPARRGPAGSKRSSVGRRSTLRRPVDHVWTVRSPEQATDDFPRIDASGRSPPTPITSAHRSEVECCPATSSSFGLLPTRRRASPRGGGRRWLSSTTPFFRTGGWPKSGWREGYFRHREPSTSINVLRASSCGDHGVHELLAGLYTDRRSRRAPPRAAGAISCLQPARGCAGGKLLRPARGPCPPAARLATDQGPVRSRSRNPIYIDSALSRPHRMPREGAAAAAHSSCQHGPSAVYDDFPFRFLPVQTGDVTSAAARGIAPCWRRATHWRAQETFRRMCAWERAVSRTMSEAPGLRRDVGVSYVQSTPPPNYAVILGRSGRSAAETEDPAYLDHAASLLIPCPSARAAWLFPGSPLLRVRYASRRAWLGVAQC